MRLCRAWGTLCVGSHAVIGGWLAWSAKKPGPGKSRRCATVEAPLNRSLHHILLVPTYPLSPPSPPPRPIRKYQAARFERRAPAQHLESCCVAAVDATFAMHLSHSTLSNVPFVLIAFAFLFCAPAKAFAVPWARSSGALGASHPHPEQSPKHRSIFPQLTWLRDTVIEKVFSLPPKAMQPGCDKHDPRSASSQLPSTLLARYGGDVVLRFNLSTQLEEQALAEAADTLFLDVWEFTSNWADVRLREDDVSLVTTPLRNVLTHLGPITSRVIAQVSSESIFESDARPCQDDLPILPLHHLWRAITGPFPL